MEFSGGNFIDFGKKFHHFLGPFKMEKPGLFHFDYTSFSFMNPEGCIFLKIRPGMVYLQKNIIDGATF